MQLSLNTYSLAIAAGYYKVPNSISLFKDPSSFIALVKQVGFDGLELPLDYYYSSLDCSNFKSFIHALQKADIRLTPCIENFDLSYMQRCIPHLSHANLNLVRIKMPHTKTFYGGNRYKHECFFDDLERFSNELDVLEQTLCTYDVRLAIENHQDLDVNDLVRLCERSPTNRRFITWDVGNSLATMRTPFQFVEKASEFIANIHFKDYKIARSGEGIALIRTVLGEGVLRSSSLSTRIKQLPNVANISMELAAHPNRVADIFHPSYPKFFDQANEETQEYLDYIEEQLTATHEVNLGHQVSLNTRSELQETILSCEVLSDLFRYDA